MHLPEFQTKHLLQEEIEVIIEKVFTFTVTISHKETIRKLDYS